MEARYLALLLILPFVAVFLYAAWHEFRRYRRDGKSTYGLTYDPESNTTYVGTIPDDAESYDPKDYDPEATDALSTAETEDADRDDGQTDRTHTDDNPQDDRK